MWNSIDDETADMLESMGITSEGNINDLFELTPDRVLSAMWSVFGTSFSELKKSFFSVLSIIVTVALFSSLLKNGKVSEAALHIGQLTVVFILIAVNGELFTDCRASIELTEDFMLCLLPVITGIISFSGHPSLALSVNSLVFSFAQGISAFFANILPAVSVLGTAVGAACALSPFNKFGALCKIISKCVNICAAFISGIFVAVLSVRGVIAGAADTVTIKGLRFLVGSSIPVVGSAIGDALNSLSAGLGLIKNSVLVIGVIAVALINIAPLIKTALWSLLSYFLSMFSEILYIPKISEFISSLRSVLSVLIAVTCFNTFLYVISCAILLTLGE